DHAAVRDRDLHVRGRVDRRTAGVHLCHSHRHLHRWRSLPPLTTKRSFPFMVTEILDPAVAQALHPVLAAIAETTGKAVEVGKEAGKSIALGVGAGGGAAGAGAGIGMLFGKVIEAVTRQPEMRDEITSIQWL